MNTNGPFNFIFECEDCKKHFPITGEQAPNSLTHKKEYNVNGQSIFLTYYDCPHCGKRHFAQIDDVGSMQELERIIIEFRKLNIMRKKGKTITKKQSDKFKKARHDLSEHRIKLMKEFTGKTITDIDGSEYVLRFSII